MRQHCANVHKFELLILRTLRALLVLKFVCAFSYFVGMSNSNTPRSRDSKTNPLNDVEQNLLIELEDRLKLIPEEFKVRRSLHYKKFICYAN